MKVVIREKNHEWTGCWIADIEYPSLNGKRVHTQFAAGEGIVARHLCSIKRCINPLHLVRGTRSDNMEDEALKQHMLKYFLMQERKAVDYIVKAIGYSNLVDSNFKLLAEGYAL